MGPTPSSQNLADRGSVALLANCLQSFHKKLAKRIVRIHGARIAPAIRERPDFLGHRSELTNHIRFYTLFTERAGINAAICFCISSILQIMS